jgi:hypothetical protein
MPGEARYFALGAVVTLAGVLVGSASQVPSDVHIAAAIILAVLAAALGIDMRRIRLTSSDIDQEG